MKKLAREIVVAIVSKYGPQDMVKRISDPFRFQALGCILGFDRHSSGVSTTTCRALKGGSIEEIWRRVYRICTDSYC